MKLRLGRLLFPNKQDDERKRDVRILLASLAVGLLVGAFMVVFIFVNDSRARLWLLRIENSVKAVF